MEKQSAERGFPRMFERTNERFFLCELSPFLNISVAVGKRVLHRLHSKLRTIYTVREIAVTKGGIQTASTPGRYSPPVVLLFID